MKGLRLGSKSSCQKFMLSSILLVLTFSRLKTLRPNDTKSSEVASDDNYQLPLITHILSYPFFAGDKLCADQTRQSSRAHGE